MIYATIICKIFSRDGVRTCVELVLVPSIYRSAIAASKQFLFVKLTRIMSRIFHCIRTLYSTHTNNTYRCHKETALAKEVTSNLLGGETYDCINNVPILTSTTYSSMVIVDFCQNWILLLVCG